ncbi:TlpA disulfide reductase family protein [Parasegetibacter sp. NRK P23]|uniref:TlpA family protein disulfide reductase n=1 Tax=Parasegetibacter sp. NRK P23 TaxID=2942999 RepID=UPI0020433506|nr:TlpA disulfide reductase family protein [Parasegetibacter sp. NRK P23]MCM5529104.1 TlpA family protein disulfide reductase [Parasegetibacter sp. NRK P23]
MKRTGMNKILLPVALLAAICTTKAQTRFKVSPEKSVGGKEMQVFYNPKNTALEGLAPVKASVAYFKDFSWQVEEKELEMKMVDSGWVLQYTPSVGTGLVTFNFHSGDKTDKGEKPTYTWMLMDSAGQKQQRGAYIGWAMLRLNDFKNEVPPFREDSVFIENSVGLFWINQELRNFPESRRDVFPMAVRLLQKENPAKADTIALRDIAFIRSLPDPKEREWVAIIEIARNVLRNKPLADSLEAEGLKKFPAGQIAFDKDLYAVFRAPDAQKRAEMWTAFKKKFPLDEARFVDSDAARMYYLKVFRGQAFTEFLQKGNEQSIYNYLPVAPVLALFDFHRHIVAGPLERLDEQKRTPQQVLALSNAIIAEVEKAATHTRFPEARFKTLPQWKDYEYRLFKDAFKTHAFVLSQTGSLEKALAYAEMVKGYYEYKSADFNKLYTDLLLKNRRVTDAVAYAERSARENAVSPEMIDLLKKEYVKKNKNEQGFETYFASLKSTDKAEQQKQHLKDQLISMPIASFALESNKGGIADLSKQKGKIVVLDFWATWCAPCKAAMPGMQMAVNKYASDPNVQFYFIATQETKADYKKMIADFLTEKKYNFNVLYDGKNPATGKPDAVYSKYAKSIGFSGIPQKMIIDGKGNLRWRSTGYMGSPSELADEISYVIELLKAEK